jgi:hypothetical protein
MRASTHPAAMPATTFPAAIPEPPQSTVRLSVHPRPSTRPAPAPAPVRAPRLPRGERLTAALLLSAASMPALLLGGQPLATLRALGTIVMGAATDHPAQASAGGRR